jgi:RNA recognition motif-containing protein
MAHIRDAALEKAATCYLTAGVRLFECRSQSPILAHPAQSGSPPLFDPAPIAVLKTSERRSKLKNIFVGNLSFGTTEDSLRSLFQAYGSVDRVNIITDRDSGQPRGFGFVEMSVNSEGDNAIRALNGSDLDGRSLNVNEARPKVSSSGGRGGSRNRW